MSDDENAELVHDWESDCYVLRDEITRLRADLAAVTKERDRMRDVLKPFANMLEEKFKIHQHDNTWIALVNLDVLMRLCNAARAALEGVMEPLATHKEPDEHLNLKNAECLPSTVAAIKPEPPR